MSAVATKSPKKQSIVRMPGDPDEEPGQSESVDTPSMAAGVGRAKREDPNTDYVDVQQKDDFSFPLNSPFEHPGHEIIKSPEQLQKEYTEALAFADEAIGIYILPSTEKYGAKTVPCWVGGKGIELWDQKVGRWYEAGEAPRGMQIITKRKYVEVLLKSKTDAKTTQVIEHPGADPENILRTDTACNYPIQVWKDPNPKGREWFNQMVSFRM